MAVGAKARGVVGMIVGEGARIALLGALVGVAVSMGSTRLLSRWLYQVSPTEPVVFVSLALLSVAIGTLACLLPARRAARIDPVESLRAE
jgi:ABC-type antimicrobial peptide transport system permease subunit